jgi:hypothetical protein
MKYLRNLIDAYGTAILGALVLSDYALDGGREGL